MISVQQVFLFSTLASPWPFCSLHVHGDVHYMASEQVSKSLLPSISLANPTCSLVGLDSGPQIDIEKK